MTSKDILKVKRLIGHLRTAEKIASEMEITLGNGGEVGSLVGSMADELEIEIGKERTRNRIDAEVWK